MAIELNTRTKVLAGVVVLAAAGAAAWVFFLQDFLDQPPPRPAATSVPAKQASKAGAPKPAAEAPKLAAQPPAKPIPANPDQLLAEVIELSGIKTQFQAFGGNAVISAAGGAGEPGPASMELGAMTAVMERIFEPSKMTVELAAGLKSNLDAERMARFVEILRNPIALKITALEGRQVKPEEMKQQLEEMRKTPPTAARAKLIQAYDEVSRTSELGSELIASMARDMIEAMLADMLKAGKSVPKEARETVGSLLNPMRDQAPNLIRGTLFVTCRNASDEDLAAYIKLMDTDTGRWGTGQLVNASRPVLVPRGGAFGKEIAKLALAKRMGAMAKASADKALAAPAPEPLPKAQPEPSAEQPAAAAASAPAEPAGYQRPAKIKELYSRYNDLISATVMRDQTAVKEMLGDGKNPNVRQKDGATALMIAVGIGDAGIAGMLLAKGADPNLRAAGGTSALSLARERGAAGAGLVQLLQRHGAKD